MKLLITTQAVDLDDPILGFFHRWLAEFAGQCASVEVICLREGRHELPPNVHVHSLGKERSRSRVKYLINFYRYIWRLRRGYDAVFVHMNPEYVLLGGLWWRAGGKRIVLWYVHKGVTLRLRTAVALANAVCTAAPQSIGLHSRKIKTMGHGIDTASFSAAPKVIDIRSPHMITVGRVTPIKHLEVLIEAIARLGTNGIPASLDLIGAPVMPADEDYVRKLRDRSAQLFISDRVRFLGTVPNREMPRTLSSYDIALNASPTGGVDKAALESMAVGIPTFVSNESFREYLGEYAADLMYRFSDAEDLAHHVERLLTRTDLSRIQSRMKELAAAHSVERLIPELIEELAV